MLKTKLRHKTFFSSLKKSILKLKERLALCTKECLSTVETSNKTIDKCVQETKEDSNIYPLNIIDLLFSITGNPQKENSITTKSLKHTESIENSIKNKVISFDIKAPPNKDILQHFIYYNKLSFA